MFSLYNLLLLYFIQLISAVGDVGGGLGASSSAQTTFATFWGAVNETISFTGTVKLSATVGIDVSGIQGTPSLAQVQNLFQTALFVKINEISGLANLRGGMFFLITVVTLF